MNVENKSEKLTELIASISDLNSKMREKFDQMRTEPLNLDHTMHQIGIISELCGNLSYAIIKLLQNEKQ